MPTNFAYITKLGSTTAGDGNSEFSVPRGLTTDGNYLWIADSSNNRIKKLKLSGLTFVAHYGDLDSSGDPISGSGDTGFDSPQDILYWNELLFVSDSGNDRIKIHRANDMRFIKELTGFSTPKGLAANRQYLWVADSGNNRISRIKLSTLTVEQNAGSSGSGNQQLNGPTQIAYDAHERVIFISDRANTRILKWDAFGAMTYRDSLGLSSTPTGVAVKDHTLYVLTVTAMTAYDTSTLTSQDTAGSNGTGNTNIAAGSYVLPWRDSLLFTDSSNNRLMVWVNYDSRRARATGDDITIGGDWFEIPIGGIQEGADLTIGGSNSSDLVRWVEEQPSNEALAWQEF